MTPFTHPVPLTLHSCSPLPYCLLNLTRSTSISLPEALLTCTLRPAQLLGGQIATSKGQLTEGYDADLCVFGWDGSVLSTWVGGDEVWRDESLRGGDSFESSVRSREDSKRGRLDGSRKLNGFG